MFTFPVFKTDKDDKYSSDLPYYLTEWQKIVKLLLVFHYHSERCTDNLISIANHYLLLKMNLEIHFLCIGLLEKEPHHIKTSTLHPTHADYSEGLTFKQALKQHFFF